ncbi:hypothetical protein FTT06_027065, partial [Escherichia coli]|nr:hypothetical protein [Escherichia coli]
WQPEFTDKTLSRKPGAVQGGELPLVPGKDWNNQQNIYHRWLKGETKAQREKIQKLIPAVLAILPRELRHRLCIFDTLERRALL